MQLFFEEISFTIHLKRFHISIALEISIQSHFVENYLEIITAVLRSDVFYICDCIILAILPCCGDLNFVNVTVNQYYDLNIP